MPKVSRKRKNSSRTDVEYETVRSKPKYNPYDENALEDEEKLENILFGEPSNFLKSLEEAVKECGPSTITHSDSGVGEDDSDEDESEELKPAWVDEDDDGIDVGFALRSQGRKNLPKGGVNSRSNKYSNLLKHKYISIVGTPKWAMLKREKSENSDSDDEILQTCGFIHKKLRQSLQPNKLEFKKLKDLNCETYNEGPYVSSVEFHPTSSVGLVTGNNGIATLFAVDGKRNNKLHSMAFEKFPITCARLSADGNEAVLGSRKSHIFVYDLMEASGRRVDLPKGLTTFNNFIMSPDSKYIAAAGKWGEVFILSSKTKEKLFILKQNSEVTALAFNPQSTLLYGHSDSGEVTIWDMNTRRVKHKFTDDGCIRGSTIAISSSNQYLATGSAEGVVNLYNLDETLAKKMPTPRKSIFNLTTSITNLKFNYASEILALSSSDIENSVRLLHIGSNTVFNDFPTFGTKLGLITSLNFSPGSGYLALGNKKSTVALYRLKHYKTY